MGDAVCANGGPAELELAIALGAQGRRPRPALVGASDGDLRPEPRFHSSKDDLAGVRGDGGHDGSSGGRYPPTGSNRPPKVMCKPAWCRRSMHGSGSTDEPQRGQRHTRHRTTGSQRKTLPSSSSQTRRHRSHRCGWLSKAGDCSHPGAKGDPSNTSGPWSYPVAASGGMAVTAAPPELGRCPPQATPSARRTRAAAPGPRPGRTPRPVRRRGAGSPSCSRRRPSPGRRGR